MARVGLAVALVPQGELALLRLLKLLRGRSEEDQDTFKGDIGPHGGDEVSSMEGDNPPVGVRVEDSAQTPCL